MKQIGLVILLALGLVACNNNAPPAEKKSAATETTHPAKEEAKKPAETAPAPTPAPSNPVKDVGKQVEHSVNQGDAAIKKAAEGEAPK
jgi:hypothetical protein